MTSTASRRRAVLIGAITTVAVATAVTAGPAAAQKAVKSTPSALNLSPVEQKMRDFVNAHASEQIDLLQKAVDINSGTLNLEGVRKVGALFGTEFASLGMDTTWVPLADSVGRAGHLYAEHRGKQGKRIILLGHLDTVFEGDGMKFVRLDTLAAGAGSSDMKGGDVVILYALKALKSVGALDNTQIIVALTGDEEDAGLHFKESRKSLIDAAKRSDIALGFEEDAGKGTIARRGMSGWQLTVTGKQSHSSGIFTEGAGDGAIYEAARILDEFRQKLSGEKYLTFNPALIVGGTDVTYDGAKLSGTTAGKDNIIARSAIAHGDLRFISNEQEAHARDAMRDIVANHLPGTTATITFEDGNPAMPPTKGNYALLAKLDSVSRALGQGPVEALDPGDRGAGDISFISDHVDALDGLGVIGFRSHSPDERVDLRSITPATIRAAVLIYRLTR
ncbi:MAG: M20/M25/M40 family metallo-hydrolase [Gemmatimonadaceae bacterium]